MQTVRQIYRLPAAQRGFTLLELMIASIIFAIMAIMAYGGLDNVIKNSESSKQALKRLQQVQQSVSILNRDLAQIVQRSIRDEYGNKKPYLTAGINIDNLIEFTRGGRVNPANMLRSSLLRVAYQFDEDKLIRLQWPQLDRAQGVDAKKTVIIDSVEEVTFRFLDDKARWHKQWPPLNNGGQGNNSSELYAIEVVLQLNDWGDIRRLYSLK